MMLRMPKMKKKEVTAMKTEKMTQMEIMKYIAHQTKSDLWVSEDQAQMASRESYKNI